MGQYNGRKPIGKVNRPSCHRRLAAPEFGYSLNLGYFLLEVKRRSLQSRSILRSVDP